MNPPSLQNRIVATLPFEKLESICFDPDDPLHNTLLYPCQWDIWRDRAEIIYGCPPAFFDLPRTFPIERKISGVQRYIEISNSYQLNPQAGVRVYSDGLIEDLVLSSFRLRGVYEAAAGLIEALTRNDPRAVDYFLGRISPETLNFLLKYIYKQKYGREASAELTRRTGIIIPEDFNVPAGEPPISFSPDELMNPSRALSLFQSILRSGKTDHFDEVVPYVLPIGPEFRLNDYIPKLEFQVLDPNWSVKMPELDPFPLFAIPGAQPQTSGVGFNDLIQSALFGGNPQMVDFLRSYFLVPLLRDAYYVSSSILFEGYNEHRRISDVYSILQRFASGEVGTYMIEISNPDIFLYLGLQTIENNRIVDFISLLEVKVGDIPSVLATQTLLSLYIKSEKLIPQKREIILKQLYILLDVPTQPDGQKIVQTSQFGISYLPHLPDLTLYPLTKQIYREMQAELQFMAILPELV